MLVLGLHVKIRTIAKINWKCWESQLLHDFTACNSAFIMQPLLLTLYFAVQFLKEFLCIRKLEALNMWELYIDGCFYKRLA